MYTEICYILLFAFALGAWAQIFVRPRSPGWPRFTCWLPFAFACFLLPATPGSTLMPALAGIFTLGAFKLLAFCFNRGPLMLPLSPVQFGVVTTMPLVPAEAFYTSGGLRMPFHATPGPIRMLWDAAAAYASCLGICSVILAFPNLYWPFRHWLIVLGLFQYLQVWGDAIYAVITLLVPMSLAPRFNKPWMSDSIEDFWARRWNLVTTYTFRTLVYEPIMQGHLLQVPESGRDNVAGHPSSPVSSNIPATGKAEDGDGLRQRRAQLSDREQLEKPQQIQRPHKRSALQRFIAVEATFILSGIWHMAHFWYNTQMISFKWPIFFIVQAPIIIVERWLTSRLALAQAPRFLRIVITNVILIAIAGPIFIKPLEEAGLAALYLAKAQNVMRLVSIRLPQSMLPWVIQRALQQQVVL